MKLSMWILYDWLAPMGAVAEIQDGRQVLRGVRHFAGEEPLERQNVYVGAPAPAGGHGGVICAHGHDLIRVPVDDVDLVFNQVLRAFDFYNAWTDGLREKIRDGCPLVELLNDSDAVFDDPLSMLDAGYTVVAVSDRYVSERSFDEDWVYMIRNGRMRMEFVRRIHDAVLPRLGDKEPFLLGVSPNDCLCQNLFVHGRLVGWISVIVDAHPLTRGRMLLLTTLAGILEEWLRLNEDDRRAMEDTEFLRQLLRGEAFARMEIEHRFGVMGWGPADEKVLVKIAAAGDRLDLCEALCADLTAALADSVVLCLDAAVVVLANLRRRPLPLLKSELSAHLAHAGLAGGLSKVFTDLMALRRHYLLADAALRYGASAPGGLSGCQEHAVRYAVDLLRESLAVDMLHPDILRLRDYDSLHGTDFCETLHAYLLCERSLNRTAERMHLHRNTLYYRLTRLDELMTAELDSPEVRLHLLLSFLLEGTGGEDTPRPAPAL